ncbi:Inhibitor of growth protein 3, partial [Fragariocoptes setiger]
MLYFDDYLELIEHLPEELRDRLTDIRELDLQVHNSIDSFEAQVQQFFESIQHIDPDQREQEFNRLLADYQETIGYSDEKIKLSEQISEIVRRLIKHLNEELEKFKLDLEADHAGITQALEARSLELDDDSQHLMLNGRGNSFTAKNIPGRRRSHASCTEDSKSTVTYHPPMNVVTDQTAVKTPTSNKLSNGSSYQLSIHHYFNNQQQKVSEPMSSSNKVSVKRRHSANPTNPNAVQSRNQTLDNFGFHYYSSSSQSGTRQNPAPNSGKNGITASNQRPILNQSSLVFGTKEALDLTGNATLSIKTSLMSHNNHIKTGSDVSSSSTPMHSPNHMNNHDISQQRNITFKNAFGNLNNLSQDQIPNSNNHKDHNAFSTLHRDQALQLFSDHSKQNSDQAMYISMTKSGRKTRRPKQMNLFEDESPRMHAKEWSSSETAFDNRESMPNTDLSDNSSNFSSTSPQSPDFSATIYQRDDNKYCICRQVSYGEMVACDNVHCESGEWFHYDCVGITAPPKGKWFCPDCAKKLNQSHGLKKRGRKSNIAKQQQELNLNSLHHQALSNSCDM